ncbi:MAG: putative nitrogen fixation protein NifT [Spirulinaceae cyanobacterium RM2_2_10]|nr:putative nitrogen fixation protein NifT [Spirulinaceae cyanobacterium SM2_1_0]NJO18796.1 putative nitrogen fixation protein NifT [Spirulinaceae cyanobacterium RM2_2_10]
MKVMLRHQADGKLSVYVAKKDLEETVVEDIITETGHILTLSNGWRLETSDHLESMNLPTTINAKRLD